MHFYSSSLASSVMPETFSLPLRRFRSAGYAGAALVQHVFVFVGLKVSVFKSVRFHSQNFEFISVLTTTPDSCKRPCKRKN